MSQYTATNIRLPMTTLRRMKVKTAKLGVSLSSVFRDFAEHYVEGTKKSKRAEKNKPSVLEKIAQMGYRSKYTDTVERMDEILDEIRMGSLYKKGS